MIEEVGAGVEGLAVGDRVLAIPNFGGGGFAESTTASAAGVFPVPESMPFAAAAALHVVYQTGHLALHRRGAHPAGRDVARPRGARAGSGARPSSSGSRPGARLIATVGGPDKVEVCKRLGVDLAARLPRARFRRRGEGVHQRPRRGRDLRPGRRRHVRPVDEVHRVRGPHPDHRLHGWAFRRGPHEPRADQELLRGRCALGAVQRLAPGARARDPCRVGAPVRGGQDRPAHLRTGRPGGCARRAGPVGMRGTYGKVVCEL